MPKMMDQSLIEGIIMRRVARTDIDAVNRSTQLDPRVSPQRARELSAGLATNSRQGVPPRPGRIAALPGFTSRHRPKTTTWSGNENVLCLALMIYMVVIGFWLHDRNIFNCFTSACCSVCRMGGTELTFHMIYISAIGQLVNYTFIHDLHSFNWFIEIFHIIHISLIGLFSLFVPGLELTNLADFLHEIHILNRLIAILI
jgi:hypothetical protein